MFLMVREYGNLRATDKVVVISRSVTPEGLRVGRIIVLDISYTSSTTSLTDAHPLTLTTFLFPFCAPAIPGPPGPPTGFSAAFMPAFTVSISTPVEIAGEYGDTRFARGGCGSGGIGRRRPPTCLDGRAAGDFDFVVAGCFPLLDNPTPAVAFVDDVAGGLEASIL